MNTEEKAFKELKVKSTNWHKLAGELAEILSYANALNYKAFMNDSGAWTQTSKFQELLEITLAKYKKANDNN